jgi:glycosyltransferase involved in cell wall biosynthesis
VTTVNRRVFVDDRYRGQHGIGRYAHEVLGRLGLPWSPLGLAGRVSSPTDVATMLPRTVRDGIVYSPGFGALLAAPRQLLTVMDFIHLESEWPRRAINRVYYNAAVRRQVRRCGAVVTISETSAIAIRHWLGDDSVAVVNAGVGCGDDFRPEGRAATGDSGYILYVGNLRRHKNLGVILRAMDEAKDVTLKAVLPVQEHAEAMRLFGELGLTKRVRLMHGIDDAELAREYRGASATVMPSLNEGFGLPALESICCGTPVIYWRGCNVVGETVGDSGWAISEAANAEEWAAAIVRACETNSRILPPDQGLFSWERTAKIVTSTLLGLIGPTS